MLDTRLSIETPEGTEIAVQPAGPVVRSLAYSTDLAIRLAIQLALAIPLAVAGTLGLGILSICVFILEWFYPVFFELLAHGMTPGKRVLGIQVIHEDGTPVSASSSVIRNLLRFADFFPFVYTGGLVSMIVSRNFKRLGDLAAGTIVIYRPERTEAPVLPEARFRPPPIPLTLEERGAIVRFAERSTELSPARSEELARILSPLVDRPDREAVLELYRIAGGLLGTR